MSTNASPLSSLIVKFLADSTDLHEGIKGISEQLGGIGESFDIGKITEGFAEIAAAAGIATGTFEIASDALKAFSKAEDVQTSFALLSGSTEQAKDAFEGLKETAIAIAVPFEKLIDVSQRLAPQFGVGTQQLQDVLQAAGDAAAATGRDFDAIATGLDRIAITGQVSTRQLVQLGVSVGDIAQTMGVSVSEATELLKKNGQSAQADVDAVVATIEQKFGGAAEAIAQNLSGQFTNLKTELGFISEDLGAALAPLASGLIEGFKDLEPTLEGVAAGAGVAAVGFERMGTAVKGLIPDFVQFIFSGSSMISLGTAAGFAAQGVATLVDILHAAVLQTTDLATGNFKQFAEDFKAGGLVLTEDLAKFGQIAEAGDKAQKSLTDIKIPVLGDTVVSEGVKTVTSGIYGLSDAFKDLGVKVPPTQGELDKLANALTFIQQQYEAGLIPLSTYDAAVGDFAKKMAQLNGAFVPQGPIDELGEALKKAGIKDAGQELEQLQRNVAATGAAFETGRGPASDYADAIKKMEDFVQKNSTEGIAGLGNQLEIVGEQFRLGKVGGEELAASLDNLIQAGPALQDSVLKQAAAIAGLNVSMQSVTETAPTVDQILRSFGVETADDVTAHIKHLQDALDAANADMAIDVPGAAVAAQLALQALRNEQQKLSETALDDKMLGIPNLETLKARVTDVNGAYEDLAGRGLLNSTTALEANIAQQRAAIDLAVQQGQDTTNLRIDLDATTEALRRQTEGMAELARSLKGVELGGLQNIFHDILFDISKVGTDFAKLGESMVDVVANRIIKDALNPLLDSLDKVIANATTALEKVIGIKVPGAATNGIPGLGGGLASDASGLINKVQDIGAGGTGAIGDIVGTGDTLAGVGGTAASAGAGGAGAFGLSSGLTAGLGLLASGISAATGIVSIFQNMHQETSLNAIESNTRVGALYTLAVLQEAQGARDFSWNHFFPELQGITSWAINIVNAVNLLPPKIADAFAALKLEAATPAAKAGQPITFNIYGATDPAAVADTVAGYLKTLSPVFA